ncbi:MAG TPA: bi-domain-containing oxidoreductase [Candidatus Kapabacteria bacterium]|jgi:polar amino acid transport system substrate-binding protein|nr:bi-domain-containing oxidoreductase [Candidatus Kapabacteria bacterium]HPP39080.1 bi-domain-containing oxidoreductase [Candidatus Kapabacteria bacterium]HPU22882.1 bi-domain-containing oxidoreductase [Candidatus Kapabacteria bacterium]
MLQVVQYQKDGRLEVAELPAPQCPAGGVLIQTRFSLISAGTERTSVENTQSSLLSRARKQPEQVRQVLNMVKRDGLRTTIGKVLNKLDSYKSLGYSVSGVVVESDVEEFAHGDKVAAAGAGYAVHAEFVAVPKNLVVRIPEGVSFEDAAYTTLGAIAMQGFRQAEPVLGETVAVVGLGLLGQLTVQLLKSAGCRVVGMDINPDTFDYAKKFGCDLLLNAKNSPEIVNTVNSFTNGNGVDSVIITASTSSNEPTELALNICRKRGKIVVVGAVGMNIPRSLFYTKEIDYRISCSYGPGRYDPFYEEYGQDYPFAYVRWTENRNMMAFLQLIADGKMDCRTLTTHTFPITDAVNAYNLITGKTNERYLGILLRYNEHSKPESTIKIKQSQFKQENSIKIGFIGAGNFAQNNLLPALKNCNVEFLSVSTATPVNAKSVAERFGFHEATTNSDVIANDTRINTLFIASRHDSHSHYVVESLRSGKNVFVEKPLAVNFEQLDSIKEAIASSDARLLVGFNRRFSAPFAKMKEFFANRQDKMVINYRINAGFIPTTHWIHSPEQGGRIIGEVCHFIDCAVYLTGALPISVFASSVSADHSQMPNSDNVSINLKFSDGSIANILYFANGSSLLEKEYCEVHCERKSAIMNNFTTLDLFSQKRQTLKFDGKKGIAEEVRAFIDAIRSAKPSPISIEEIIKTTEATFYAVESLKIGLPIQF